MLVNRRHIQPGYSEGRCDINIFQEVNCSFSDQIYSIYLRRKWGVDDCREDKLFKSLVKKQILDLNMLYDPELCKCIVCLAPCGIVVTGQIFNPIFCYAPENITVDFEIPEITCTAPEDVLVSFSYQSQ